MYRIAILFTTLLCFAWAVAQAAPIVPSYVVGDSTATITDSLQHYSSTLDTAHSVSTPSPASDTAAIGLAAPISAQSKLPSPFAMVTNLPGDWLDWSRNTFQVKYLPLIGVITVATVATVVTDHDTYQPLRDEHERTPWFHDATDFCVNFGDGKYQFALGVAFGLYGFIFHDTTALRTASQTTEVILACGAVVQLLKHLTGRESPFVATTPTGRWAIFPDQIDYAKRVPHYDAFPSGHVATALATLTVIAENYPKETWIKYVGYPMIGALAVGMVAQGIHWWSDYPLSIALGYSFGMLVAHRGDPAWEKGGESSSLGRKLLSAPQFTLLSDGTPAVGLAWRW